MALTNPTWITQISDENHVKSLKMTEVEDHPLKPITVTERIPRRILNSQSSTGRTTPNSATPTSVIDINAVLEGIDPLNKFAMEVMDPLTMIANEQAQKLQNNQQRVNKHIEKPTEIDYWESKKSAILSQFTTSEKISIVTSFLTDDEQIIVKAQTSSTDKLQSRLEQLDYFEEGSQKKFDLSQGEYVRRIDQLNRELVNAWNAEQRVKALKIAIQCAKMLSDTNVLQFYPSKFVLITDILDVFGKLVFERLKSKAFYTKPGSKAPTTLPDNFSPDMVHDQAKETCRNWFYKIASIRELVPRIYVEMAILKSYSFLTSSEYSAALMRLTHMIRGIGNPLVSIYARCYLCKVGLTVISSGQDKHYLIENFYDFLDLHKQLVSRSVKSELSKQSVEIPSYLTLYTPALDFILQTVANGAQETVLSEILGRCQQLSNSSLLLNTIMSVFKPNFISLRCMQFLDMICKSNEQGFPQHVMLRTLGLCVIVSPPPVEDRKKVLATVWNHISQIRNPENYLNCVEPWAQYAVQYFMSREGEVNWILGDFIQHMSASRAHEKFYVQMKNVFNRLVLNFSDIEALLSMDNFLPLIDIFQQETYKVEVCKTTLLACQGDQLISDPVIINTLIYLCSVLHDSVNALTIEDETKQINDIISSIVRKVDYGRDFEQQLTFYVDARGSFSNLHNVLAQLIQCVNNLSVKTRSIVNGHHTRKTAAFVRACAAYCFITIPSIQSVRVRLELYLHSGQVALFNNCLGQADCFFKAALTLLPEYNGAVDRNSDVFIVNYVKKFLSLLLVVPDAPDKVVLHLTKLLLNILQNFEWQQLYSLADLYLSVLDMLSAIAQDQYPYYIDKVESNDVFYGGDPKFITEVNKVCTVILKELLNKMENIGASRQQATLAQKLVVVLLNRRQLDNPTASLVVNLWQLSIKHGYSDLKYTIRTKNYLVSKFDGNEEPLYKQILNKLATK